MIGMMKFRANNYKYALNLLILFSFFLNWGCHSQEKTHSELKFITYNNIKTGAQQTELYFNELKGKKIGICCNQTSRIGDVHLVDSLLSAGFDVEKIFSPEHGFRGDAEAGALISGSTDKRSGKQIISLYGSHKKPTVDDLKNLDLMIFDIQDVGVRFYTYISTLAYVMEACAESGIPVILLDRPNPNGFYIDGPVLDTAFSSFVGMFPIPIVYGMTIGEFARMINGEGWLKNGIQCSLMVIPLKDYEHSMICKLPIRPSPNLPDWQAVYLYPSLALFEGTVVSVGRGTDVPFQVIGHPDFSIGSFSFKPRSIQGVSENPPYKDEQCYGTNVSAFAENIFRNENPFTLQYLIGYYNYLSKKTEFFNSYFDKLAGNDKLRKQIEGGITEDAIRSTWKENLSRFRRLRSKYLLYKDF